MTRSANLLETLDPEVRDDLRRVLIRDQLRPRRDLQAVQVAADVPRPFKRLYAMLPTMPHVTRLVAVVGAAKFSRLAPRIGPPR